MSLDYAECRYPVERTIGSHGEMHGVTHGDAFSDGFVPVLKRHGHGGHEALDDTMIDLQKAGIVKDTDDTPLCLVVGDSRIGGIRLIGSLRAADQHDY